MVSLTRVDSNPAEQAIALQQEFLRIDVFVRDAFIY
jgi:hypothetical protein